MYVSHTFKRIKITAKTAIAKPGNGPMGGGKTKNLLLIHTGKGIGKEGKMYLVKGLRGYLNHAMMEYAKQQGIEICHSSDKEETQTGERLLPEGFHPNGSCYPTNECIRHKLMGSMKKQSILRFDPVVIISDNIKGEFEDVQKIHIATDNRNALMQGTKKGIQDFSERYISGEFTFCIELLQELTEEELAFLLKSILYLPEVRWGASANNGAGKLKLLEVNLQEVTRSRTIKNGKVLEEEQEQNLWQKMEEVLENGD